MSTESNREQAVRAAFRTQAEYCRQLGAPFTAQLSEVLAECLSADTPVGKAVLGWVGDPSPTADGVPLRIIGGLHALARSGRAPELTALYPPAGVPGKLAREVIERSLIAHASAILAFLDSPPQTNEVGRSAALLPGLLEIARLTGLPLALREIGSSAGLNLQADRFRYRFGDASWGSPQARVQLEPNWLGTSPPIQAPLRVISRLGCDLAPVDIRDPAKRERLMAYVWADQTERLQRLQAAIDTALVDPAFVEQADAAEWVERNVTTAPGAVCVLFHSIVWMYLPASTQEKIEQHVRRVASTATTQAPLAWLRFELEHSKQVAMRLTVWPDGTDRLLAEAHPHGSWVRWLAS